MSEKKRNIFLLCSTHSDSQLWHDLSKSIQDKFKLVGMVLPDDSHIFDNKQGFDIFKHKELYTGKVQNGAYRNADIDIHTSFSNDCNPPTTDIIEIEKNLLVYPNPTSEKINISVDNFNKIG